MVSTQLTSRKDPDKCACNPSSGCTIKLRTTSILQKEQNATYHGACETLWSTSWIYTIIDVNDSRRPIVGESCGEDCDDEVTPILNTVDQTAVTVFDNTTYAAIMNAPEIKMGLRPILSIQITAGMVARNILREVRVHFRSEAGGSGE